MKKLLLAASFITIFGSLSHAAKISVTVGNGSLQPGTTAGMNISSGTIQEFRNVNQISTGTYTILGGTLSWINGVSTGTRFDRSTTTFQGAVMNGSITDNSTKTLTGTNSFQNITSVSTSPVNGTMIYVGVSSVSIKGSVTGTEAPSGYVGEFISSSVVNSSTFPATTNYAQAAVLNLTPGDWDVGANIYIVSGGATWSNVEFLITSTAGNNTTGGIVGSNYFAESWTSSSLAPLNLAESLNYRFNTATALPIYLKVESTYTVSGPPQYRCYFWARRRS
jgi:hypothetical protein